MKTKVKNAVAMFCNLTIIAFTLMCVLRFFRADGGANMTTHGAECFKYFTVDSNILLALTSGIALFFNMTPVYTAVFNLVSFPGSTLYIIQPHTTTSTIIAAHLKLKI